MHFSLFVLLSVLLENKQKFKRGGVDKCEICMRNFNVLDLFFGLMCIILLFTPYFSYYAWFWLVRVLVADFR